MKTIEIDGNAYQLDVEKAKSIMLLHWIYFIEEGLMLKHYDKKKD